MPLPRSAFTKNLKRTPLYTLSEAEEEEDPTPTRPKSANNVNKPEHRTFQADSKLDTKKNTPSGSVFKSSDHSAFSSSSSSFNSSLNGVADTTSKDLETVLDELKCLGNDVQLLLDRQQQFSDKQVAVLDTKFDKHYSSIRSELNTSITSGISKSQSDLSALCAGIEQLKNFVESTYHRSGTLSESSHLYHL